jgi:glucose-1-phosphate adenylyltransferase
MRSPGETWYQGTADAIYQNINLVEQSDPHVVAIFGGDHIYRMNVMNMIEYHVQKSADVTVAAIPVDKKHAVEFGVIEVSDDGHILAFHEKRPDAPTIPGDDERVFASMGNYVFSTRTLLRLLHDDAAEPNSSHDFGRDILPKLAGKSEIYAYDFQTSRIPGEPPDAQPYWRDVGTIDAYYEANMDLRAVHPALNLYNREWPLRSTSYPDPPAKFTFDEENRRGQAIDSIVSGGCILAGGQVKNSVLGRGVRVHSGAVLEGCVVLDNCDIGRRAKLRRAILDKNVRIPEDAEIGFDLERDRQHHHVTESGIVVIGGARTPVDIAALMV